MTNIITKLVQSHLNQNLFIVYDCLYNICVKFRMNIYESQAFWKSRVRTQEKVYYYVFMVYYNFPFLDDISVIVDWSVVSWAKKKR